MARLFALLVGINAYPPEVGRLEGCVNDIEDSRAFLSESFADPAIVMLKDADATRANVIGQFREHLGQAGNGDVAVLHYCGHGDRAAAAPEFARFDLGGMDEGLVCIDSAEPGKFHLADKELSLLLGELSPEAHVALIMDCCHSGSGTRNAARPERARTSRAARGTGGGRPLESYLDGQFAARLAAGEPLVTAPARHMLLAGCDRTQTAKEDLNDHRGIFTLSLFDVLRRSPAGASYADLFVRSRARVRQYIGDRGLSPQEPQFETVGGFDAHSGFLSRAARRGRRTYSVGFSNDRWRVECGAVQGMPTDPSRPVALALRPENDAATLAGTARTVRVGAQSSELELAFEADPAARYMAEITSLPEAPMLLAFEGPADVRAQVAAALEGADAVCVALVAPGADDGFVLEAGADALRLRQRDTGRVIRTFGATAWQAPLPGVLAHLAQWRRSLALHNPRPRLDPARVDLVFVERLPEGGEHAHAAPDMSLELRQADGVWQDVRGRIDLRNRTGQLLHWVLVRLSEDFGVQTVASDQIAAGDAFVTIVPEANFSIDGGAQESVEQFKLILSTERVDDFLLQLDPLEGSRGFSTGKAEAAKPVTDDWFTRDLRARIVRRADAVGPEDVSLAGGRIVISGHPGVTGGVGLATAIGGARGGGPDVAFANGLAGAGLRLAAVGGERGENPNILEITGITNASALAGEPLRIRLDVPLAENEAIVPLVRDGRHTLLAGDTWRGDDGATHISIDRLPAADANQRSIGGAIRMYFFKTYLHAESVNRLRWVSFEGGTATPHATGVADRVAAARNVLLLVHGIIGDTVAMAAGVGASGSSDRFDLVLTYDYENLATPIEETARLLAADLARAGLKAGDGKRLTMLAHSMGGLVSRWFIEREGGAETVDHLVMCGTPNAGSPFGHVGTARKILTMLATIGVNVMPQVCAPALMLLARSRKVTPTLEQMAPGSPFMKSLNAGPQAPVRYSILAGDLDAYQDPDTAFFAELLVKAGRSPAFDAMFGNGANDIAVGVDSIFGDGAPNLGGAARAEVACHHLNYFSAPAGREALKAVAWEA